MSDYSHQTVDVAMRRRQFLGGAAAGVCLAGTAIADDAKSANKAATETTKTGPWLKKTVKLGMVAGGSIADRFAIAKQAGFLGIEPNVPLPDKSWLGQMKAATESTGIPVDGTVGGYHWSQRHSDPDAEVRKVAQKKLIQGINETHALGGESMLLVPGHGKDGTEAEVIERSSEAIRAALPIAKEKDVKILIENVWNQFLYEHNGPNDQSAKPLADYIDSFDSPLVGVQFDIGNHWKYGDPAAWIRTLGPRIMKLDIKGFSRKNNKFTDITKGDIRWEEVRGALRDIGFTGWVAAEVGGGPLDRLKTVASQIDEALRCNESLKG